MADVNLLAPKVLQWESRLYTETPGDLGGATKDGITLATWQAQGYDKNHDGHIDKEDVKLIDDADFTKILKKYWDEWKADDIKNQSVAEMLVDWVWTSGKYGIVIPQRLLGVPDDGNVGPVTLAALNKTDQQIFFTSVYNARLKFLKNIVASNPYQVKFLQGWVNRLNSFKFVA